MRIFVVSLEFDLLEELHSMGFRIGAPVSGNHCLNLGKALRSLGRL